VELRARTGIHVNPGNVYRELAKLSSQGLIGPTENPRDADVRRNPYVITQQGSETFDEWVLAPATHADEIASWLSFFDRVPAEQRQPLLERVKEGLWLQSKRLTRDREDAMASARSYGHQAPSDVGAVRSLFELKQVTAMLEFVEELTNSLADGLTPKFERPGRPKR
jgi:DNA-binding PadR family transcriptional regulator